MQATTIAPRAHQSALTARRGGCATRLWQSRQVARELAAAQAFRRPARTTGRELPGILV
jgi:hypothetical protein